MRRTMFIRAWHKVIDTLFPDFMMFFLPKLVSHIDWRVPYAIVRDATLIERPGGVVNQGVDKLVKYGEKTTHGAETAWLFCYITWPDTERKYLPQWLWTYFYRLYEKRKTPLTMVALLLDNDTQWRPAHYTLSFCGGKLHLGYACLKITDFFEIAKDSANPMASFIEMHQMSLVTETNPDFRLTQLCALMKQWYHWGYPPEVMRALYHFKETVLPLPPTLNEILVHDMTYYQKMVGGESALF